MRISTSAVYNNFIYNQQVALSGLLKVNNQLTTGLRINFGYEETTIYQDALRLINERETLLQSSDNIKKAQTFSYNTDAAINSMIKTLETFKIKLVQAANDVHSTTSYAALAADLKALMFNIRDMANTSINGSFLFSGTNMKQKPFDESGIYKGNDARITALVGDGVNIAYNIDGWTLMQGIDNDYSRRVTTNLQLFNQTLLHHRVLSKDDPMGLDSPVPITASDTIRDLIGQPDDSKPTYFYLRGSKPDGEAFKSRLEFTNGATVRDLMDQIGRAMGNTNVYQAVEVSLNNLGHIEIKDVKSGRMLTDLHLVASDVKTDDISTLGEIDGAHIFSFIKSGYSYARTQDKVGSAQNYYDERMFDFNTTLRRRDSETSATKYDSVQSVMGENVDNVTITINGVAHNFAVNFYTTIEDLTKGIKSSLEADLGGSFDVGIQNGKIAIFDNVASSPDTDPAYFIHTKLQSVSMEATNSNGEKVLAFSEHDALAYDRARFEKAGANLNSTISQISRVDGSFATGKTELKDISGAEKLDEKRLHLEINGINGERKLVEITLRDVPDANGRLSTYQIIEPQPGAIYDIYDNQGNHTTASGYKTQELVPQTDGLETRDLDHKGVTYQQLMNIMGIAMSGDMPAGNSFADYNAAKDSAAAKVSVELDEIGRFKIRDKTTSESKIQVSLFDADTDNFDTQNKVSDKTILQTFSGAKGEPGWTINEHRTDRTLDQVFGFKFAGNLVLSGTDMNGAAVSVTLTQNSTLADLQAAIDGTFGDGVGNGGFVTEVIDGRLITRDNINTGTSPVQINFLFEQAESDLLMNKSPAFSFAANNVLTIDQPRVNVFAQLEEAISATKMGMTRPDGNSEIGARNMGIQNAIYVVDHLLDHFNRLYTENGSVGMELKVTYEKTELMVLNVKTLKSEVLDADIGEAAVKMNQLSVSYQALLSSLSRIHSMSLVNYL
ncbi:MAG: hypothetical protein LBU73_03165 [Helicobacteraceae bacterium]|nr:hypothetical protein [Helicobacteraceae bacterium]